MRHILSLFVLLLVVLPCRVVAQRREVRVTAAQASVYDAPRANAEILGSLARGTSLFATGRTQGDWLEIEAPAVISGWIFGELLQGDVVEASSVRVRSGAGVGFEGLATLVKGDRITRRGSQGGWVSFEGIPAMRIWIERSLVSAPAEVDLTAGARPPSPPPPPVVEPAPRREPPPPAAPPAPVAVVRPEPVVVAEPPPSPVAPPAAPVRVSPAPVLRPPVVTVAEPRPLPPGVVRPTLEPAIRRGSEDQVLYAERLLPARFRPVRSAPQGQRIRLEGVIRPVGLGFFRPTDYRLTMETAHFPSKTVAYLLSDDMNLQHQVGRTVILSGIRFWLMGVREPVIVIQSIN